jgi:hypothetical protein
MSRHTFSFFFSGVCFHSAKPLLPSSFPSALFVSHIRPVQGGVFCRCCYLITTKSWGPTLTETVGREVRACLLAASVDCEFQL